MLRGDFNFILNNICSAAEQGSMTASLEDGSDCFLEDMRCAVRVYERYSYTGQNRVSLSITMVGKAGGDIFFSAIASGGSQALLFKINTFGEEAFLETIIEAAERFRVQ